MNLDVDKWGTFRVADLFPVLQNGKANQGMLSDGNECFYVGAKKDDNGVMIHCAYDEELVQKGNCIIFICNGQGSVGYANYMDVDFIGTTDIVAGYNENLNQYNGLFIATILCQERPKYSFGRKWKTHLRDTVIKLPQTEDGEPDWDLMEAYIKTLKYKPITTTINERTSLNTTTWKEFEVGDLLEIFNGRGITKDEIEENPGELNAVQSGEENNGCIGKIDKDYCIAMRYMMTDEPCLTVARSGSVGFVSFHPSGCVVGDSAKILLLKQGLPKNPFIYLFLRTVLMANKYKYTYGRKVTEDKYFSEKIRLPVTDDGTPDFLFMESYMKALPYGNRI